MAACQEFVVRVSNTFLTVDVAMEDKLPSRRSSSCPPRVQRGVAPVEAKTRAERGGLEVEPARAEQALACPEMQLRTSPARCEQWRPRWADLEDDSLDAHVGALPAKSEVGLAGQDDARHSAVVLKNIPNRVGESDMLAAIAGMGFGGEVVRLDLPTRLDKKRLQNKGYAFVWFTDRAICERFCCAASGYRLGGRSSPKALVASLADWSQHSGSSC